MRRTFGINVGNIAWIIVWGQAVQLYNAECHTNFNCSFRRNVACIF